MKLSLALLLGLAAAAAAGDFCSTGPCTQDETCCQDDQGFSCCIDQTTYCVPKETGDKPYPSRCCSQWTVGCLVGSVGCCDPARPWQRTLNKARTISSVQASSAKTSGSGAGPTIYALFTAGGKNDLNCLTVDTASGNITNLVPLSGPAASWDSKFYGESTREYPWDSKRQQFFAFDVFPRGKNVGNQSAITLFQMDPATGSSTSKTVKGVGGNPVSFVYHPETASAVLAVGDRDAKQFSFFTVNLDSGAADLLATVNRGANESSAAYYCPYMTEVDAERQNVLRLGYESVSQGSGPGLGVTPLTNGQANGAKWEEVPSLPDDEFFYSLSRRPSSNNVKASGNQFVSLAPSLAANHTLALVEWAIGDKASDVRVLLDLPNAHPPGDAKLVGNLGYIAQTIVGDVFAALVVQRNGQAILDRWEVVYADLKTQTGGSADISGHAWDILGAETVSVSGVGIKA